MANMMDIRRNLIASMPHVGTAYSGSFSTDVVAPLKSLRVDFVPAQSGSGDPSPTNVRAISGWTGATINNGGQSQAITWTSSAGTVYGGYVDLVSGTMTLTHGYIEYDGSSDEKWYNETLDGKKNWYIKINDAASTYNVICNMARPRESGVSFSQGDCMISSSKNFNFFGGTLIDATVISEYRAWLAEHTLQVAYILATPQVISITPSVIRTLRGANSFSATGMTVTSATFWTH